MSCQPIATAPRDGTPIILWAAGYSAQVGRWYDANVPGFYSDNTGSAAIEKKDVATHWQPLPPGPTQ